MLINGINLARTLVTRWSTLNARRKGRRQVIKCRTINQAIFLLFPLCVLITVQQWKKHETRKTHRNPRLCLSLPLCVCEMMYML